MQCAKRFIQSLQPFRKFVYFLGLSQVDTLPYSTNPPPNPSSITHKWNGLGRKTIAVLSPYVIIIPNPLSLSALFTDGHDVRWVRVQTGNGRMCAVPKRNRNTKFFNILMVPMTMCENIHEDTHFTERN